MRLPPTAIGKDWRADGLFAGLTPSRTGIQASLYGLAGVTVGWVEGVERSTCSASSPGSTCGQPRR